MTDRALDVWKKTRDAYVPPPLEEGVREAVTDYVARRTTALSE